MIVAGEEVLRRYGVQGFAIRHVTTSAGFTRSAIYQHFGSKRELATEILEGYVGRLIDEARGFSYAVPLGAERLTRILEFWVREYVLVPRGCIILRCVLEVRSEQKGWLQEEMQAAVERWRLFLCEHVDEAIQQRHIPQEAVGGRLVSDILGFALALHHECVFLGQPLSYHTEAFRAAMLRHGYSVFADFSGSWAERSERLHW